VAGGRWFVYRNRRGRQEAHVSKARATDTNWAQVRDRIHRGETGDKIAVGDPAAAPLGTDAEAGGAATRGEHIGRSATAEDAGPAARAAAQRRTPAASRGALAALAVAAVAVVGAVIAVALGLAP
jgi:hypothetical protein